MNIARGYRFVCAFIAIYKHRGTPTHTGTASLVINTEIHTLNYFITFWVKIVSTVTFPWGYLG